MLDLQAAQSASYRERGVARYALDYTLALAHTTPELLGKVLVRSDRSPIPELQPLVDRGVATTSPDWSGTGGIFHALSPFDIATPVREVWPRQASRTGRRLVVTVYDLIPELFADTYLVDPGIRRRYRARRELVRAADHVMTLSQSAADDVVDHLGVPDDRVSVVGAACSDVFRPEDGRAGGRQGAATHVPGLGRRYVVYNGGVEFRKNMEGLIRAFARLPVPVREGRQLVVVCRLEPSERHHYEVIGRQAGLGDQLLLPGQVSDPTLVQLYRGAELVVFPSLYEGYGLPVAEAMACGAPVVASGNSSLVELVSPEATFDPTDADDLARAIERGLVDQPFRDRLLRWSARPRPSWNDVAERAGAVYRRLDTGQGRRPRRPAAWRRRPLIALVTPWPPAMAGVASYSRRLARALSVHVEVDVFIDGGRPDGFDPTDGLDSYLASSLLHVEASRGGYDAIVACIGNSEHHAMALKLMRLDKLQAVVLAHDVRLTGLYRHGAARGAVPEGMAAVLSTMYPQATADWITEGWVQPADAEAHEVFMAGELVALSQRFLVTSEFAAEVARLDARPEDRGKVQVCPFSYPDVVRRPPPAEEPGLICSFGLVNEVKQPWLLLESFALLHHTDPTARLVFVGPVDTSLLEHYGQVATGLGIAGATTFTGTVDDLTYERWLSRASVAVQLRASSNGETSAAVADCLCHGVVTVVTDAGPAGQLPDFVEKVPVDATPERLAEAIRPLLDQHRLRERRSEQGLEFVAARGFDRGAEDLLEAIALQPSGDRQRITA